MFPILNWKETNAKVNQLSIPICKICFQTNLVKYLNIYRDNQRRGLVPTTTCPVFSNWQHVFGILFLFFTQYHGDQHRQICSYLQKSGTLSVDVRDNSRLAITFMSIKTGSIHNNHNASFYLCCQVWTVTMVTMQPISDDMKSSRRCR